MNILIIATIAIETAITNGASFLLSKQAADGHWSDPQMPALTALPLWALSGCAAAKSEELRVKLRRGTPAPRYKKMPSNAKSRYIITGCGGCAPTHILTLNSELSTLIISISVFLNIEGFKYVAFLDVVEFGQTYTALKAA